MKAGLVPTWLQEKEAGYMTDELTPEERSPYFHTDLVDYGNEAEYHKITPYWDIDGLLKAQLAKDITAYESTCEALIQKAVREERIAWIKAAMKGGILIAKPSDLENILGKVKREGREGIIKEPTKGQINEFWEYCKVIPKDGHFDYGVNGGRLEKWVPCIDLNSLFRYAVVFLVDKIGLIEVRKLLVEWARRLTGDDKKDALALFWALYSALGKTP